MSWENDISSFAPYLLCSWGSSLSCSIHLEFCAGLEEKEASCVKMSVCILPFKTVMALINWIATMPGVTMGQGLWQEHALEQSGNCCIVTWKIPLSFCFSYSLCWYSLHGILIGRKKNYNRQDGVLPAIKESAGGLGSLFFWSGFLLARASHAALLFVSATHTL